MLPHEKHTHTHTHTDTHTQKTTIEFALHALSSAADNRLTLRSLTTLPLLWTLIQQHNDVWSCPEARLNTQSSDRTVKDGSDSMPRQSNMCVCTLQTTQPSHTGLITQLKDFVLIGQL